MNSHILSTYQDFLDFVAYVNDHDSDILTFDTETDGVVEKTANLYGLGLCLDDLDGFYIPFKTKTGDEWWDDNQHYAIVSYLVELMKKKRLVGWNAIFDLLILHYNWNVDFTEYLYSDGILQKHLLSEERPFGLKECAVQYLGPGADKAQKDLYDNIKANGGSITKTKLEMFKADTEILGLYCAHDVLLTRRLFDIFEPQIKADASLNKLFYEEEVMHLYREVTIPMKKSGFPIDVPHFQHINEEIAADIISLENEIYKEISPLVVEFEKKFLEENYPVKRTGNFPKLVAEAFGLELPKNKTGGTTLTKKALSTLIGNNDTQNSIIAWLREDAELPINIASRMQLRWFHQDTNSQHIFNLKSNKHLQHLFFHVLGEMALSQTESGDDQVGDAFLDEMSEKYEWVKKFRDLKKLNKLKSTYIESILEKQLDGVIYASFLQFGTTSSRFASNNPNLQNLPAMKGDDSGLSELVIKYINSIKRGFIAPKGYVILNADYSQLEPRAFSIACGDILLQQVFHDRLDLYGSIAVRVFNLDCAPNEVKKKYPTYRQKAKVIALAVVYGAGAGRISKLLDCDYEAAQTIINDYLDAFPGLKAYIENCHAEICTTGKISSLFGRVRRLPEAKRLYDLYKFQLLNKKFVTKYDLSEAAWKFKSYLNLSCNHKIQSVAAHIVNRAMLSTARRFKAEGIDGVIVASVHDEQVVIIKEEQAERGKEIVRGCLENTTKLAVPLIAEPIIAKNWLDAK